MTKKPLTSIKEIQSSLSTAIEDLAIPIDDALDIKETTQKTAEENKAKLAKELKEKINETIKQLKEAKREGLDDFVFEQKIELLEKTKKAVEVYLLQILSSPNGISAKAIEVLGLIIKVNADLIKDISDNSEDGKSDLLKKEGDTSNIFIAPSDAMLKSILNQRHKN